MKIQLITSVSLAVVMGLSTGCNQMQSKPVKPVKQVKQVKPKKDQKLVISEESIKEVKKDDTEKVHYQVNLNNIDKNSANIIVKNEGEKPLIIDSVSFEDNNKMFKLKHNCKAALAPEKTCKLNIEFRGNEDGKYISMIKIISNDPREKQVNISIEGTSKNKFKGWVSAKKGEKKRVQRGVELNFDALNNKNTVTLKNTGLETLALKKLKLSGKDRGSFTYMTDCKTNLKVSETCDVVISYDKTKKEGSSVARLNIISNGILAPSDKIRLVGYSKPYMVTVENFIISKNIKEFLGDYFSTEKTYFVRTIFQTNIDNALESEITGSINNSFKEQGYKIASSASNADKVITIYPSITVPSSQTNSMLFNMKFNGNITTKATAKGKMEANNNLVTYDQKMEFRDSNSTFSTISSLSKYIDKESFEFGLQVNVDNVTDKYEVYETVSKIITSKIFNVIGIK